MDSGPGPPLNGQKPPRSPVATAVVAAALAIATVLIGLVFSGRISLRPSSPAGEGTVFYLVPYHYGFAFYDRDLVERERIEVKSGEKITLVIVPAQSLPEEVFLEYAERSLRLSIGGLPAGDSKISAKIMEDLALGNVEHIIGIAAHPVYVTTNVAAVLGGERFRRGGPRNLAEAVHQKDPAIKSVTFTAKRVGSFDVLCVDSGMEGTGTCGWGHKWMVAKGALVVLP
jgi:hypothetical protein